MNEFESGDLGPTESDLDMSFEPGLNDTYGESAAEMDSVTIGASVSDGEIDWDATLDASFPEEEVNDSDTASADVSQSGDAQDMGDWREMSVEEVQEKLRRDSLWEGDAKERGRDFEDLDNANIKGNYPRIDDYDPEAGIATSCKSLDVTSESYQSQAALSRKVMDYLDDLAEYKSLDISSWHVDGRPIEINPDDVEQLQLDLAIPQAKASDDQLSVLATLQSYATDRGLRLNIIEVP